jgi:hypothetical protein
MCCAGISLRCFNCIRLKSLPSVVVGLEKAARSTVGKDLVNHRSAWTQANREM